MKIENQNKNVPQSLINTLKELYETNHIHRMKIINSQEINTDELLDIEKNLNRFFYQLINNIAVPSATFSVVSSETIAKKANCESTNSQLEEAISLLCNVAMEDILSSI